MKKVGRIILIIIIILQNIAPNIVIASETQMSKEQFQFVDVELTNSDEDISATIKGSYSKSNEEESIDIIHVSDNIKLADSTNNSLIADDGSTKGTYDILNNVITLKVKSAGNYSVKVNLSGKYNLDSQNDQVTFSHGNKSITKELKGLRPLVATVDAPDAEKKFMKQLRKSQKQIKKILVNNQLKSRTKLTLTQKPQLKNKTRQSQQMLIGLLPLNLSLMVKP